MDADKGLALQVERGPPLWDFGACGDAAWWWDVWEESRLASVARFLAGIHMPH